MRLGTGCVVRDEEGNAMAVMSESVNVECDAVLVEAMALRHGISVAHDAGLVP